jgi:hypothetical protein
MSNDNRGLASADENTIKRLEQIEDKEYKNTAEVTTATGIVSS